MNINKKLSCVILETATLPDAFNKSQDSGNVIGIWWYNIRTGNLEYSDQALGHLDNIFKIRHSAKHGGTVRGRLLLINNYCYLIIYRSVDQNVSFDVVNRIKGKIQKASKSNINYVIDDDGNVIHESTGLLRRQMFEPPMNQKKREKFPASKYLFQNFQLGFSVLNRLLI